MMIVPIVLLICHAVSSYACCTEGSTIIQIKNYEGPIYLHAPHTCDDKVLHHLTPNIGCDFDCNCVSKPASSCIPINTASQCTTVPPCTNVPQCTTTPQCTTGLYNSYPLYQEASVSAAGLYPYNVPAYPLYQDNQCYPVVQITTQCGQQDGLYTCGKCGRTYSYC